MHYVANKGYPIRLLYCSDVASVCIGNELIYMLASQGRQVLRIDLQDWEGNTAFAEYDFKLGNEATKYRLISLGKYHGDAGESRRRPSPGPSRGGKGGKFSRAPRRLGAPQSLKNTENGVPDGFFLT